MNRHEPIHSQSPCRRRARRRLHRDPHRSNLNADRLDGRHEEDFLPTRLYGNGSGLVQGPGGGKTLLLTAIQGLTCDGDDIALNAGGNAVDADDHLNAIVPFRGSYQIEFTDNGGKSNFSANIICMDNARPFR